MGDVAGLKPLRKKESAAGKLQRASAVVRDLFFGRSAMIGEGYFLLQAPLVLQK